MMLFKKKLTSNFLLRGYFIFSWNFHFPGNVYTPVSERKQKKKNDDRIDVNVKWMHIIKGNCDAGSTFIFAAHTRLVLSLTMVVRSFQGLLNWWWRRWLAGVIISAQCARSIRVSLDMATLFFYSSTAVHSAHLPVPVCSAAANMWNKKKMNVNFFFASNSMCRETGGLYNRELACGEHISSQHISFTFSLV